jgi:putative DNA primase/helicase
MSAYTATNVERIARLLGGATRNGKGWKCKCPAHDDRNPSLKLDVGDDGKLLRHCFAGCSDEAVLAALRDAGVLLNGDARAAEKAKPRVVARYDYVDEQSALLYQVERKEPKGFSQRRPDGKGGWLYKLDDVRRVLYRLPEVLAAEDVIVCEGEKDADRLRKHGMVATTSSQGAKFWRDELAAPLAGKRVSIIPDNDPSGREHAQTVAAAARKHGAVSVKMFDLGGTTKGFDISDWLDAGHTVDELRELVGKAPEWVPVEPAQPSIRLEPERWNKMLSECAGILRSVFYLRGTMPVMLARAVEAGGKRIEDRDGAAIDLHGVRHRAGVPPVHGGGAGPRLLVPRRMHHLPPLRAS